MVDCTTHLKRRRPNPPSEPDNKAIAMVCKECGKNFQGRNKNQKYCGKKCSRDAGRTRYQPHPLQDLSSSLINEVCVLTVIIDLSKKGYEVFRSVTPGLGSTLIALKDDAVRRFEVKSGRYDMGGKLFYHPKFHEKSTDLAVYTPSDGQIHYIDLIVKLH